MKLSHDALGRFRLGAFCFGALDGLGRAARVCLFFLAAQVINALAFKSMPSLPVILGGVLIVSGGLLMSFWRTSAV